MRLRRRLYHVLVPASSATADTSVRFVTGELIWNRVEFYVLEKAWRSTIPLQSSYKAQRQYSPILSPPTIMIQERDESGSLRAVYSVHEAEDHKIPREVVVRLADSLTEARERTNPSVEREICRRR